MTYAELSFRYVTRERRDQFSMPKPRGERPASRASAVHLRSPSSGDEHRVRRRLRDTKLPVVLERPPQRVRCALGDRRTRLPWRNLQQIHLGEDRLAIGVEIIVSDAERRRSCPRPSPVSVGPESEIGQPVANAPPLLAEDLSASYRPVPARRRSSNARRCGSGVSSGNAASTCSASPISSSLNSGCENT